MVRCGGVPTTTILKAHKNTSEFLEYGSITDKSKYAEELGCSREDLFHRLYAGIETVKAGINGWNFGGHEFTSLALFCPEQHSFKDFTDDMINDGNVSGEDAYDAQTKAFRLENQQWWGNAQNAILERSVIGSIPFYTNFSVGLGKYRVVNGEILNTQDWHSSSVQGILPTWRYWIENQGTAVVEIDWDKAYNVGNSIKLSGKLGEGDSHLWRLFKTMIPVTEDAVLRIVYQATGVTPQLCLSTKSSVNPDVTLSDAVTTSVNGWTVAEYNLSALKGKTIYLIGLNLTELTDNCELNLGQLSVLPAGYDPTPIAIDDFSVIGNTDILSTDLRLSWSYNYNSDFDHFDIYVTNGNGRKLVGQTRGEGFYIPRFNRVSNEDNITVELAAVMKDGTPKTLATKEVAYVNPAAPVITVTPVPAYAKVGERVKLTASGTDGADAFVWTLPSSVKLVSGSLTDATIEVEANKAGSQMVKVEVSNSHGKSVFEDIAFDCLTDVEYKEVTNAALGKSVSAPRSVVGSANYLIDGDKKPSNHDLCWSDISTAGYAVVDLKSPHIIYGFNIYDYHSTFSADQFNNVPNYRIFVSEDGEDWHKVVDRKQTQGENIHSTTITPVKARYVKVQSYDDKRFTTRFFEFEIIGRDNSNLSVSAPAKIEIESDSECPVTIEYNLNGEEQADNFNLSLESESSYISFTEPECDNNGHFTFDVNAENVIGKAELYMTLTNGDSRRQAKIEFLIDNKDAVNGLKGLTAEMRKYKEDYATGGDFDSQQTGNLTDGDNKTEGLTEEMYEDPCIHANDLWAVFHNPNKFTVGKIKVYFANGNKGVSVNDKEGFVNKAVSIRTSQDGVKWTTIETFNNLESVDELTCWLPKIPASSYLAVACDVNAYFYPSLAEVEAYNQPRTGGVRLVPLEIANGFNNDLIAENKPTDKYAESEFLSGYFYTSNIDYEGAISDLETRTVYTSSGTPFILGKYDSDNVLNMSSNSTTYTLTLAKPFAAERLHMLCAKTLANMGDATMTVKYTDGTVGQFVIKSTDVEQSKKSATNPDSFDVPNLGCHSYGEKKAGKYGLVELRFNTEGSKEIESVSLKGAKRFFIFGLTAYGDPNPSKIIMSTKDAEVNLRPEDSYNIVVSYDMNGEERHDNFQLKKKITGKSVKVGDIVENQSNHSFTIPVSAGENLGTTLIDLTLRNGEDSKNLKVSVRVNVPSEYTGWNEDVIVEALPATQYANGTVTNATLSLFSTSIQEAGAISDDNRKVTTSNGTVFMLAPYDENNALTLKAYTPRTLEAVTPEKCSEIRVLYISNRSEDVTITVNYEDGTSSTPTDYTFSTGGNDIGDVTGIYRICSVNEQYGEYKENDIISERYALNELAIPLDCSKKFKSISFEMSSSRPRMNVLSLAKVLDTSGFEEIIFDREKQIEAIYNMQGVQVANPSPGIYIVRYSDGSTDKIFIK